MKFTNIPNSWEVNPSSFYKQLDAKQLHHINAREQSNDYITSSEEQKS